MNLVEFLTLIVEAVDSESWETPRQRSAFWNFENLFLVCPTLLALSFLIMFSFQPIQNVEPVSGGVLRETGC